MFLRCLSSHCRFGFVVHNNQKAFHFFQDIRLTNQVCCHQLDRLAMLWPHNPSRKDSVRICSSLKNGQSNKFGQCSCLPASSHGLATPGKSVFMLCYSLESIKVYLIHTGLACTSKTFFLSMQQYVCLYSLYYSLDINFCSLFDFCIVNLPSFQIMNSD